LLIATNVYAWFVDNDADAAMRLPDDVRRLGAALLAGASDCVPAPPVQRDLLTFAQLVYPHLDRAHRVRLAAVVAGRNACRKSAPAVRFVRGLAAGEPTVIRASAETLRETFAEDFELSAYLLEAILFANLIEAQPGANLVMWQHVAPARRARLLQRLPLRLLLAHSGWAGE